MRNNFLKTILLLGLVLASCSDFLTEAPKSILSPTNFYRNEQEARQAVNGIYRALAHQKVTGIDVRGCTNDLIKRASWDSGAGLSDFTFDASNSFITIMWQGHYETINYCNSAIDNINLNKDKIENWERYIAEARGIRAYLYFDLLRWFGEVPMIIKETTSLNNLKVSRNSIKECYEQIIDDLKYAEEKSVVKGDRDNGYQYGRFTQEAATGLLAKVYLWIASVTERDNAEVLGSAVDNYKLAMAYARKVIDSGKFKLVDYYPDVFNAKTRDKAQDEVLWCTQGLTGDNTGTNVGMAFGITGDMDFGGAWSNVSSSDFHRTIYEYSDTIRRLWNCPRVTILENGNLHGWDYDKYLTTNPNDILNREDEINYWGGWCIGKFRRYPLLDLASYNYSNFGMDEPLLRYADILLIYAEAYNEVNGGPGTYTESSSLDLTGTSVSSAYDAVNVVRKRARIFNEGIIHEDVLPRNLDYSKADLVNSCVPDWRPSFYGYDNSGLLEIWQIRGYSSDYEAFREEILYERGRELVAETTDRTCDLVRRGILVQQMQQWRKINPFTNQQERGQNTPGAPENVSKKHYRFPIPLSEIEANPNLKQNEGY